MGVPPPLQARKLRLTERRFHIFSKDIDFSVRGEHTAGQHKTWMLGSQARPQTNAAYFPKLCSSFIGLKKKVVLQLTKSANAWDKQASFQRDFSVFNMII